jgi:hypothetical protein
MSHFPHRKFGKKLEVGQSLMELAVSITVLFIILAGIVDLGRMFFHYIAMRDAAQEAASYGSIFPTHCDQIRDRAEIAMGSSPAVIVAVDINGFYGADEAMYPGTEFTEPCSIADDKPMHACHGNEIVVTLRDDEFPVTMPFIGSFLGKQTIPLETTITGTILRPPCKEIP